MPRRNWRIVGVGAVLIVLATALFLGMLSVAPRSSDPVAMMRAVGDAAGVIGGVSLAMIVFGLIGKRA